MPTIKTSDNNTSINLDDLLSHIRLRGIAVGNPEMQRLQTVFAQAPVLSRNELRNLLSALLAKDEWQRSQIGRVFDRLIPFDSKDEAKPLGDGSAVNANTQTRSALSDTDDSDQEEGDPQLDTQEPFSWKNLSPRTILISSLAALLALVIVFWLASIPPPEKPEHKPAGMSQPKQNTTAIPEPKPKLGEEPLKLIKTIDHWVPHVESRPRDPLPQLLPALLLLLGSGLGFSWLLYKVLEASRQQKANRPKLIKESGRFHVSGVSKPADYHLLNGEQRREMAWGISRYQSEQPLNRLNIPLSVKHSAAAGMPELVFEHSSQEREVWLWQDQSSTNPDLSRLVDEIHHTLQRANITVQRGYFRGLPSTVSSAQGEVLWSNRHEYPETEPLVAIFADEEKVTQRQLSSAEMSDRTLQQLSHWSLLCFVDSSQQAGTLQRLLYPHDLECILPQSVAEWLANQGQSKIQAADNCVLDSLHQWATACALPNRVIMEDEMRALHNALGFDCAWQFHALTRYAKVSGRGFDFRAKRVDLLNELSPGGALSKLARKAVKFWISRNHDLDKALKTNEQIGASWEYTRKQRLLERDTALLKLWLGDEPETLTQASKTLYDLYDHDSLQKDISRELSHYSCTGFKPTPVAQENTSQQIILPFAWSDLNTQPETQRQLVHCGFGGEPDSSVKLCWDNATRGILAGLAALMVLCTLVSIYLLLPKDALPQLRVDSVAPPTALQIPPKQGEEYLAATYKSIGRYSGLEYIEDHQRLGDDEIITIHWERSAAQNAQYPVDANRPLRSAQHWLLGTVAKPKRPEPAGAKWPDLSIVVIVGDAQDMTVRKLAAKLLDTGSADQVLIGRGETLRKQHQKLLEQTKLIKDSQWVYVNGPILYGHSENTLQRVIKIMVPPEKLLKALRQSNDLLVLAEFERTSIKGVGLSPLFQAKKERVLGNRIELVTNLAILPLVKLPQGSFVMGSNDGNESEKPAHTVNIDYDLWMSETEVTFEQYESYIDAQRSEYAGIMSAKRIPEDVENQNMDWLKNIPEPPEMPSNKGWEGVNRPVINVSWNDAQGYVKWLSETNKEGLQCRLPSEAEWEYAARAGTTTKYPWGDEVGKNKANCNGCGSEWDGEKTAPVGSFEPNAFGLQDMHGNVWEWVQDAWHDNYTGAPNNGEAWKGDSDVSRVLRGGSWGDSPGLMRSAFRNDVTPGNRFSSVGFRIVCSSH